MNSINLHKPICFFDLETTGVNVAMDKIVEISILKVLPEGGTEIKTQRINPGVPIPEVTSRIHGIYDADVKDAPSFKDVAHSLAKFMENCDLAGYNSNKFDIPLLVEEFLRVDIDFDIKNRHFVDVQNIFHYMEPRNLSAAYKFYCEKDIINAHSAEADVKATYEIFLAQLKRYENKELEDPKGNKFIPVQNNISHLSALTTKTKNVDLAGRIIYNEKGIEIFNFGKHKDKPVAEVFAKEPSYYDWMMKGDFPLYTKKVLTQLRLKQKNTK